MPKGGKKNTQEQFLAKAIAVHGERYDYSKVEYAHNKAKVIISCQEHGDFSQSPNSHMKGTGCPMCWNSKRAPNREVFIQRARQRHGAKYDYSQVDYTGSNCKVSIICPRHGLFEQVAGGHVIGSGCPKCVHLSDTASFIAKAVSIHGSKYDYSECQYEKSVIKVGILCKQHGFFNQSPANHLSGRGCPSCAKVFRGDRAYFIKCARQQHGSKYDYSQVEYSGTKHKVTIICPQHGLFKQSPTSHLQGNGCKKCSLELGHRWSAERWASRQKGRLALLYFVRLHGEGESFYKVGVTFYSIKHRFASTGNPYSIEPIALFSSTDALAIFKAETAVKKTFKTLRYKPNMEFAGSTECFADDAPILTFLTSQGFAEQSL